MFDLSGRTAIVTGAAGGIGEAIGEALAHAGARVVLTDVDEARVMQTAQRLAIDGRDVSGLHHDVTSEADWAAVVAFCVDRHGGLDILVNNAGSDISRTLEDVTLDEYRSLMAINADSVLIGMQAALPALRQGAPRWRGGAAIINNASLATTCGVAGADVAYHVSKAAVRMLTQVAAHQYGPYRIRTNSLHPGTTRTRMFEGFVSRAAEAGQFADLETGLGAFASLNPLGLMAEPSDIAGAAVFLASDAARFINGAQFIIDGGFKA